ARGMVDRFRMRAKGGDGGNGCVSLRRSRSNRHGMPDGGNGGKGGDVILECSRSIWDFSGLQHHMRGGRGGNGVSKNQIGTRGSDKIAQVPVGTQPSLTVLMNLFIGDEEFWEDEDENSELAYPGTEETTSRGECRESANIDDSGYSFLVVLMTIIEHLAAAAETLGLFSMSLMLLLCTIQYSGLWMSISRLSTSDASLVAIERLG
ncbi:hypothetical protein ACJX0J_040173, partial [Zea mays]